MNKLKFLSLVALTVLSSAVLAAETEGPWTYVGMRSGTCDQNMNNSISYNNLDNSHWGTVTFWNYDSNGIGFVVQGSSKNNSKNAVYSLYSLTKTIPSYSRCQITWKYQVKGQNVKHYSRTTLYEHTNQSTLQAMAVDFTLDLTNGSGSGSRLYSYSNKSFDGIQTSATQTRSYDFDNRTGTGNSSVARYLLMTHVSTANEEMNNLDEWGSFLSVSATETWTYRAIFTFDGNGNTGGSMSNQTIDNTGTLTANAFTRTGYTFSKWTANKDGSGSVLGNKASVTASSTYKGPKTLYAQWTANKYTVTLNNQSATTAGSTSVEATYNAAMPKITVPTRTGYTFGGYYTEANGNGTQYIKADGTSAKNWDKTANTTLYAKWTINQYTITFDCNGGSAIDAITQNYGTAVTAPADPTREGYTFAGWDPALPETMPAENMTVVAQWNEIPVYAVEFALGDAEGTAPAALDVTIGEDIAMPVNKTLYKEGYTLTGWSDGVNTYAIGNSFTPANDVVLTPVFTANEADLLNASSEVTVKWYFGGDNGAPTTSYEGTSGLLVAQATIGDKTVDVKLSIDATSGKFAPQPTTEWANVQVGTIFTYPYKAGMTVNVGNYKSKVTYYIADAEGKVICYYENDYYSFIEVTYPASTPGPATAIDNANANAKAVKRIEDGQLLIERDGKTYNIIGTMIQ